MTTLWGRGKRSSLISISQLDNNNACSAMLANDDRRVRSGLSIGNARIVWGQTDRCN